MDIIQISSNTNGHPRFVVHFLAFLNEKEKAKGSILEKYEVALQKAKKHLDCRKYKGKDFGGGIVVTTFMSKHSLENKVKQIANDFKMRPVRVTFEDGNIISTNINGTDSEIRDYYKVGSLFNIGRTTDNMQKVAKVEIMDNF